MLSTSGEGKKGQDIFTCYRNGSLLLDRHHLYTRIKSICGFHVANVYTGSLSFG